MSHINRMNAAHSAEAASPLFSLGWDTQSWSLTLTLSSALALALILAVLIMVGSKWWVSGFSFRKFEIDQAEIGVGNNKFRFRPNLGDKQIAYAIWVELSTRKIGLPIDFEDDVVDETYNSWFEFFSVTRGLIKGIPVSQVRRDSTQAIIKLSIEVLNEGLRPHLTKWQARFRRWYNRQLKKYDEGEAGEILYPQQIQIQFPQYAELKADMERVNQALMRYRAKMRELVLTD